LFDWNIDKIEGTGRIFEELGGNIKIVPALPNKLCIDDNLENDVKEIVSKVENLSTEQQKVL
jgi:hypothetical protein